MLEGGGWTGWGFSRGGGGAVSCEKELSRRSSAQFYGFIHHPGKLRLKRSGQFSGSPTESEREGEEDCRGGWSDETAAGDSGVSASRRPAHLCLQHTEAERDTRANVWRLFAEAGGGLMSLKGQTPLRKINGISSVAGGPGVVVVVGGGVFGGLGRRFLRGPVGYNSRADDTKRWDGERCK